MYANNKCEWVDKDKKRRREREGNSQIDLYFGYAMLSMPTALINDDDKRGRGPIRGRRLSKSARTWRKLTKKSSSSFNYANVTNKARHDATLDAGLDAGAAVELLASQPSFIVAAIDQFSRCFRAAATAAVAALSLGRRRRRRFSCLLVAFVRAHCLLPRYSGQGYQPADRTYRTHLTS